MKKKNNPTSKTLITIRRADRIRNVFRVAVVKRMNELGWTPYRLAKELAGKVSAPPVYSFVAGKRDLRGDSLAHVLKALRLTVKEEL